MAAAERVVRAPHGWADVQAIARLALYDAAVRSAAVVARYEQWLGHIKTPAGGRWASAGDYLRHFALGLPLGPSAADGLVRSAVLPAAARAELSVTPLWQLQSGAFSALLARHGLISTEKVSEADGPFPSLNAPATAPTAFVLRRNDFPYDVAAPLEHWCLWAVRAVDSDADIERLVALEVSRLGLEAQTCWFVNPAHRKTVPDLWHAHVFTTPLAAAKP